MFSFKRSSILSFFLLLTTFFTAILAAPLPASSTSGSTISKRYNKFDAENAGTILTWLQSSGADSSKLVFYSNPDVGLPMVDAFIAANEEYKGFYELYGEDFENAFGFELEEVMDGYDPIHARPMSQAMVNFATGESSIMGLLMLLVSGQRNFRDCRMMMLLRIFMLLVMGLRLWMGGLLI